MTPLRARHVHHTCQHDTQTRARSHTHKQSRMDWSAVRARRAVAYHRAAVCVRRPRRSRCQLRRALRHSRWRRRRSTRRYGPLPSSEGTRLLEASALLCGCALSVSTRLAVLRAQALAQLRLIFPSMPPSAIADALRKAGGSVEQAADLLFKAAQARPACTVGTRRASPRQPDGSVP